MEFGFGILCFLFVLFLVSIPASLIIWFVWLSHIISKAKIAYSNSLAELSRNPTNPDLYRNTLLLGRKYARLTKQFDELGLQNDLNAATAGGVRVQETVETVQGTEPTRECPSCGGVTLQKFVKCKHCGSDFSKDTSEQKRVECGGCGQSFKVKPEIRGKVVKCPKCKTAIQA